MFVKFRRYVSLLYQSCVRFYGKENIKWISQDPWTLKSHIVKIPKLTTFMIFFQSSSEKRKEGENWIEVNRLNSIPQVVQFYSFIFSQWKIKIQFDNNDMVSVCMWKLFAANLLNTVSLHLSTLSTLIIDYLAIFFSDSVGFRYVWGYETESVSSSVVSNSLWPRGLQPTRLLCPWDSLGKNTGVAVPFFRRSSLSRDLTQVSCTAGRFFTVWTTREAVWSYNIAQILENILSNTQISKNRKK